MTGNRFAELEAIRRPFVFRKYLDFGAINAMRDLHAQIRHEVMKKDQADNVKLGPGGIREIEFIAQVFQLIRGGRDQALQIQPTLSVLKLLADNQTLAAETSEALSLAYDFLRRVEHACNIWMTRKHTVCQPVRRIRREWRRPWVLPIMRLCFAC